MKQKFGTWLTSFSLPVCDLISSKNFDWICIDMEHSTISNEQMSIMIDTVQKNNKKCFVRLSKTDDETLSKIALDSGADGLIFPKIESLEQAKKAVDLTFYPPTGKRGAALYKAQRYGNKLEEYVSIKSKKIELILMIETKKAINNLDVIYKRYKKYISSTIIGLYDLSASCNLIGKINHPLVNNQLKKYQKLSKTHRVPMGIHHAKPFNLDTKNTIKHEIKKSIKDYKYVAFGTETLFLNHIINDLFKKIK